MARQGPAVGGRFLPTPRADQMSYYRRLVGPRPGLPQGREMPAHAKDMFRAYGRAPGLRNATALRGD